MTARRTQRSPEARAWQHWYRMPAWRQKRARQLAEQPWCVMCWEEGRRVRASVADHVVPHKGDPEAFWQGALQSMCWTHHSRDKQRIERVGYSTGIGADGWPTDPKHPANGRRIVAVGQTQEHGMAELYVVRDTMWTQDVVV
jgi:5-methylcytosine-specific restriction enzyme A